MTGARILLPRVFLRRWLARGEGAPLAPKIRGFMEIRFGTSFADVRIHKDAVASCLCDALQARSLILGGDIVFGDGQYAPATATGRRLLAHALVHVLQQRAAPAPAWRLAPQAYGPLIPIGDPDDRYAREAEWLADEALAGGLRSGITADSSGALRRAIRAPDAAAPATASPAEGRSEIDDARRTAHKEGPRAV